MLALLLWLLITPAHADCLQWGHDLHGDKVCMRDDLVNRNPVIPDGGSGTQIDQSTPGISCGGSICDSLVVGTTTVNVPTCPLGHEPVMRANNQFACAESKSLFIPTGQ